MSGALVGLVVDHGPEDHNQWAVLTVIAEDLRGPLRSCILTYDDLAAGCRLGRTAVARAVRQLDSGGWISRTAGNGRGVASTYRLRLDSFPAEAVDNLLKRGSHRPPLEDEGISKGVASDHLNDLKVSPQSLKVSPGDTPSVSVTTPSSGAPLAQAPAPTTWEAEDDEMRTALHGLPTIPWKPALRAALGECLVDRGHTATAVNRYLLAHFHSNHVGDPYAVILSNLRAMPPAIAAVPAATGEPCAECTLPESECRRREATSGHSYTPKAKSAPKTSAAPKMVNGHSHDVKAGWLADFNGKRGKKAAAG